MKEKVKILHLEDSDRDAELIKSQLEAEGIACEISLVAMKKDYLSACESKPFDLIICDNTLPDIEGIEALRYAKKLQPRTPFIFLSGTLTEEVAIEAMRWGAADYVSKLKLSKLGITVKRVLHEYEKVRELDAAFERIKESEQRFSSAFEFAPIGIALVSPDGHFIKVNPALCKMVGYPESELLNKTTQDITHPVDLGSSMIQVRQMLEKKITEYQIEKRYSHKLGHEVWIHLSASLVCDDQGHPQYFIEQIKNIDERKRDEKQIRASLKEKEVMLQEIHHRVKNNLQIISGLLSLQADHAGEKKLDEILWDIQNRIHSMSLIHETLYRSQNLAEIDFNQYLRTLVGNLFTSYSITTGRITVCYDMEPLSVTIEKAIPLGLIANELVTNILKYAFPDGRSGEIRISLQGCRSVKFYAPTESNQISSYELTIADNGVGLPEKFVLEDQKLPGMHLVPMLVKQLQAELAVDRSSGTKFSIHFKDKIKMTGGTELKWRQGGGPAVGETGRPESGRPGLNRKQYGVKSD